MSSCLAYTPFHFTVSSPFKLTFLSHSQGLDNIIELQWFVKFEERDIIGDDTGIIGLMFPHINNLKNVIKYLQKFSALIVLKCTNN